MVFFRKLFLNGIIFVLLIAVTSCSGLGGIAGQASGDSGATGGNLSDTETGLYEDGPIDIPVTIAKLDSVDADLVTITPLDEGAVDNLSSPSFIKKLESDGAVYVVTGDPGAVNTEQATKIYGINTETGTAVIDDVESDGSFEFQINADSGEIVAIAPMVDDESEIGAPVYGDTETGVVTLSTTNTDALNPYQNLVVTDDGYTYFGLENADGSYTLYRRNLDGTPVETVVENVPSMIRFVSVSPDYAVTYITQDGQVYRTRAVSVAASYSGRVRYAETTWEDPVLIHDYEESLDDPETYLPPVAKTFIAANGDVFIVNGSPLSEGSSVEQDAILARIDAQTGERTVVLPADQYNRCLADVGSTDSLYLFVQPAPSILNPNQLPNFELYRVDMSQGDLAWSNREHIFTQNGAGGTVVNLDVSRHDVVMFVTGNNTINTFLYLPRNANTPTLLFQSSAQKQYSEWAVLSPDSNWDNTELLTCRGDGSQGSYLVMHRIGVDPPDQLSKITNSETKNSCHGAYRIDDDGRVLFYRTTIDADGNESAPQLSFIDLNKLDETQIVPDS